MKDNYFYKKPLSNIYKKPNAFSEVTSQILYGEKFKIISKNKSWIKIKTLFDNYTGYIKNKYYTKDHQPTHKIFTLKANIYNKQKNKTKNFLPFASRISMIDENKKFIEFEKNKWIKKKDIKKINHIEKDYLKVLKMFLKIKYLWGGKTYRGIDCSAILQLFFYYNNKFYPRDTKDQIKYSAKKNKSKVFKKGDIIFWKGHVAVCINAQKLIHAYGPEKKVLIMNIKETINRIERTAKLTVKKISPIKY
ncbi:C40 family peptidase [Candidatus Pelagibacter ubique]|jgi:cell wall-associated NlpC family hydrolase|nr:SH3 domain-containing C40 family peptidase [Candidatus Pelagibacter bacterium]MDA7481548.1 C40 family peptidase [Candidatus Pelagibacter ubique]MDB2693231.1 C40 family peptidase [Candidatus Pelagibacter bacterium]MDC1055215.1 NlpC/P60 family protein [Candidatus Pelagibacter ubique]